MFFFEDKQWLIMLKAGSLGLIGVVFYIIIRTILEFFLNTRLNDFYYSGLIILVYALLMGCAYIKWVAPCIKINKIIVSRDNICFYRKKKNKVFEIRFNDIIRFDVSMLIYKSRNIDTRVESYIIRTKNVKYNLLLFGFPKLLISDDLHQLICQRLDLNNQKYSLKSKYKGNYEFISQVRVYNLNK